MKILYITTIGSTMVFFKTLIRELIDKGIVVDIATNENDKKTPVPEYYRRWGCNIFQLTSSRTPMNIGNIKAIKTIREIVEKNKYDVVHCHTPIAAACTRIACKEMRSRGTKVFYTAHGFHFYSGAPLRNWLLYYPVEKYLSNYTDVLITINKEDYERAKSSFYANRVEYVPGVGIDTQKFQFNMDKESVRRELNIPNDKFILLSVGELNGNKNHESVIKAIAGMDIVYVIVGEGKLKEYLKNLANDVNANVILTGFRSDVVNFYSSADAFILPSFREGLNVSLMEAMASGLPCLAGNIRGNIDLIDENGGITFNPKDIEEIRKAIQDIQHKKNMGLYNKNKIHSYDVNSINKIIENLYEII